MQVDQNIVKSSHELKIIFDPAKQGVSLNYDLSEFGTWEYIIGVLEMAKMHAMTMRQKTLMMQAMQEQAAAQQMQKQIHLGGLR